VLKSVQIYNAQSAAYYTQLASTSPGYTHVSKLKTLGNEKKEEHMTIISCKTLSTTVQFVNLCVISIQLTIFQEYWLMPMKPACIRWSTLLPKHTTCLLAK